VAVVADVVLVVDAVAVVVEEGDCAAAEEEVVNEGAERCCVRDEVEWRLETHWECGEKRDEGKERKEVHQN